MTNPLTMLRRHWMAWKLKTAERWAAQFGCHVVKIERRAGTDYILDSAGRWRKIGK